MNADIAPRYQAALEALELQPGHRILEIGCGHSVLVTLMCQRLDGHGHVHAIDRSAKMIDAARRRNQPHVAAGTASFQTATMQDAAFPDDSFDRILAVRVRDLWTDSDAVLPRLRRWLRSDGTVCAVIDAHGDGGVADLVAKAASAMTKHGYRDVRQHPRAEKSVAAIIGHK